ncbi:hypothetical protein D8B26_004852 [Coccidioides posadasii str. Silveira]|uniref:C6 transcription factor n=2 Tax=Coccidioides posadasii TaxID=199306 RepID=E9D6D7_COCPS|nr:C6 transcription factor [Coccidioides posadasii str. Silveira]KMM68500.1 hypothetical protein CPAG_04827 [Coccidioides posadasii RMSCC 3488]QVM10190.1 hypothetical protein D8B26_004852 [Coccidioides posadasii str. Silveira]
MEYPRNAPASRLPALPVAQADTSSALALPRQALQDARDGSMTSTNRVVKNQIVFRIKDSRKPTTRTRRLGTQDQSGTPAEPVFRPRRSHRKSRTGCGNCKRRRVKCDETKPHCQRCEAYGVSCDYTAVDNQLTLATACASNSRQIDASAFSMSVTDLGNRILEVLRSGSLSGVDPGPLPSFTAKNAPLALNHFVQTVGLIASMTDSSRKVVRGDMMRLAFRTPHLMHAILGVACTSMYQMSIHDKSHKVAEAYHWEVAIRLYKKEIQNPVGAHNMDALMSTCMMMGVLSFCEKEYNPLDSWVFSSRPTDLNWLLVQGGLRYLIQSAVPWIRQSIWWDFFMESDDENKTFDDHRPGRVGLDPQLADLCEIGETTTEDDNPYHWPLRMLSPLLNLPMIREHFSKFCTFMGRLLPPYTNLLHRKEPRACLILAIWMAKMCEQKEWWIYPRMHAECTALCMFLEHSDDPRILKLLEYPASACGYVLKHQREDELLESSLQLLEQTLME